MSGRARCPLCGHVRRDSARRKILAYVRRNEEGVTSRDVAAQFGFGSAVACAHLSALAKAGVVEKAHRDRTSEGREYRLWVYVAVGPRRG